MTLINQAGLLKQEIDMSIETPDNSRAVLYWVTLGIMFAAFAAVVLS